VPAGLIGEHDGMSVRRHRLRYLLQMQSHRRRVAEGQDQASALALRRADGAEDVGRTGALIVRNARPGTASGPAAGLLVLLPDAGLVLEPDLYLAAASLACRDLPQQVGEVFFKASTAYSFWA
jgi:hypothetical protein